MFAPLVRVFADHPSACQGTLAGMPVILLICLAMCLTFAAKLFKTFNMYLLPKV
jgi:hypothetical protein